MSSRFQLGDDGTLDTIIIDTETNKEHRFNYQNTEFPGSYEDFVEWCINTLHDEIDAAEAKMGTVKIVGGLSYML